jgi:asparagine synthase (glutamine-hydrolysing)
MRHPFFDLRLVRYLLAIPAVPWFVDKRILRDALKDRLPDAVRLRPKTPLASWPHHALAARHGVPVWMEDLARIPELAPYVDMDRLWEGLHSPGTMADHEFQSIVRALALAAWMRRNGLSRAEPAPGEAFYA